MSDRTAQSAPKSRGNTRKQKIRESKQRIWMRRAAERIVSKLNMAVSVHLGYDGGVVGEESENAIIEIIRQEMESGK